MRDKVGASRKGSGMEVDLCRWAAGLAGDREGLGGLHGAPQPAARAAVASGQPRTGNGQDMGTCPYADAAGGSHGSFSRFRL